MSLLDIDHLTVLRGSCPVVDAASFRVGASECVGLIGPNGAGKTSLMRAALGLLGHTGRSSMAALSPLARARHCAWMPQTRDIAWPMSVETLIALGRIPHRPKGTRLREADQAAVDGAIHHMGLDAFRTRSATDLSGGEQARVLIARALAQDTPLLMADEPIAGLDPAGQIATMRVFADLARSGRSVIASLHDLGLAARHCTRLILLHQGRIMADGPPTQVLTKDNIATVFGVTAHFEQTPQGTVFQALEVLQ
jgi:iron complex transport system ATP-binding protein